MLGALHQLVMEAAPQSAQGEGLPPDFVSAIAEALGVTGKLEPIGTLPPPADDAIGLDVLPQD